MRQQQRIQIYERLNPSLSAGRKFTLIFDEPLDAIHVALGRDFVNERAADAHAEYGLAYDAPRDPNNYYFDYGAVGLFARVCEAGAATVQLDCYDEPVEFGLARIEPDDDSDYFEIVTLARFIRALGTPQ